MHKILFCEVPGGQETGQADGAHRVGASRRRQLMLPIPGTGSPGHAEANVAAASIELTPHEAAAITAGA